MRGAALLAAAVLALLPPQDPPPAAGVRGVLAGTTTWSGEVLLDGDVEVPAGAVLRVEAGTTVRIGALDLSRSGWNPDLVEIRVAGEILVNGTAERPVVFRSGEPRGAVPPRGEAAEAGVAWHGIVLLPPPGPAARREIRGARFESAFAAVQVPKGRAVVEGCAFLACGVGVEAGSAYADASRRGIGGGVARPVVEGCRFAGCDAGVYAEQEGAPVVTRSVFAHCRTGAGNYRGEKRTIFPLREPGVTADRCEFHACGEGLKGPCLATSGIFSGNDAAVSLSRFHEAHATQVDLYALRGNVFCGNRAILPGEAVAGEFASLESPGHAGDPAALDAALRAPWPPLPPALALRPGAPARGRAADGGDPGCLGTAAPPAADRRWETARPRLRRPLVAAVPEGAERPAGKDDPAARLRPQAGSAAGKSWWCRTATPEDGVLRTRVLLGRGEGEALYAWRFEAPTGGPAEVEVNGDLLEAAAWWNGEPVDAPLAPRRFDAAGAVAAVTARSGANFLVLRAKGRGVDPRLGVAVALPGGAAPAEGPVPEARAARVSSASIVRDRSRGGAPFLRLVLGAPAAWAPPVGVALVAPDGTAVDTRDARARFEDRLVLLYGPLPDGALGGGGVRLSGFHGPDGADLDFGEDPAPVTPAPPR